MRGIEHKQGALFNYFNIQLRIEPHHPLCRIAALVRIVLRTMSPHVDVPYPQGGRISIARENLLRASLLQCLFSIRLEQALSGHRDFNIMFRWVVGLTLDAPVWDHSTFSPIACRCASRP